MTPRGQAAAHVLVTLVRIQQRDGDRRVMVAVELMEANANLQHAEGDQEIFWGWVVDGLTRVLKSL